MGIRLFRFSSRQDELGFHTECHWCSTSFVDTNIGCVIRENIAEIGYQYSLIVSRASLCELKVAQLSIEVETCARYVGRHAGKAVLLLAVGIACRQEIVIEVIVHALAGADTVAVGAPYMEDVITTDAMLDNP